MDEKLKKLLQRQENNPFARAAGICVTSADEDGVVCEMEVEDHCMNHLGFVHAGALYTLAENAAGAAAFHRDGRRYVTQGGGIHYIGNQKGGRLRATAQVVHGGRQTCLVRTIVSGEGGKLICTGEFDFFCVD